MTPTGWLYRDHLRLALHQSGQGPTVVFQHGLCGDASQTAEASPPGFRRLTLECRGHGASDEAQTYAIATFADDLTALIENIADADDELLERYARGEDLDVTQLRARTAEANVTPTR